MALTLERQFHIAQSGQRKEIRLGTSPDLHPTPIGRIPRVSRLMALAIRFETLIRQGEVQDYATLARLGYVTRARVTQVMNLLLLAPDIQEAILFLPRVEQGRDPITLADLQRIALTPLWSGQRSVWRDLTSNHLVPSGTNAG